MTIREKSNMIGGIEGLNFFQIFACVLSAVD